MKNFLIIGLTFLIALLLEILPLPSWALWLRPEWIVLTLLFWIIAAPKQVGLLSAFFVGVLMDLLMGSLLGVHAVLLVAVAYVTIHYQARIRLSTLFSQAMMLFVWMVLYQLFLLWMNAMSGGAGWNQYFWLPALTSAILWPWVYSLLSSYSQRYGCAKGNPW